MKLLSGHVSPETAYVVDDYPYGFRLRCKIRYWLEWGGERHGWRFCSQTTNPKRDGEVWNKPKTSIYVAIAAAMYLDENEHVKWAGLGAYSTAAEAQAFADTYGKAVPAGHHGRDRLDLWIQAKTAYEARTAASRPPATHP